MATITDKFNLISNGTQPLPTQLSAQKNAGAATASLTSATGWDTSTAKHIRMYQTQITGGETKINPATICYYKGTLSGTTLSDLTLVWSASGSDQQFPAGATVDQGPTAGWADDLINGILNFSDQDGTLKAGAVDNTAVIGSGVVEQTNLREKASESQADFVASGGVVAQSAGLVGTFSNIVFYISGVRYTATSIANKTYTVSKDTYVDINGAGTVTYVEVANGAASPALTASSIRVAKVITSGAAITSVTQNGVDSLGNKIYNLAAGIKRSLPILSRQGGNATNWQTNGTTNYDTRGLGAFMQVGSLLVNAGAVNVTFPIPFSQVPIIVASVSSAVSANTFAIVNNQTGTGFTVRCVNDGGGLATTEAANWIAIGI